ncbi:MAG: hypothetical protein R3332_12960 [Pseudohongiellaceae bacterium]|nr:hypothetical protein [Pseudohongiellaceae bacterium]
MNSRRRKFTIHLYKALKRSERLLPPFIRTLCGLLLMVGGVFGFLPVLGFWMIPLGMAFIAADVPYLRRKLLKHLNESRRSP